MPRREDHEVRKGDVGYWIKKKKLYPVVILLNKLRRDFKKLRKNSKSKNPRGLLIRGLDNYAKL